MVQKTDCLNIFSCTLYTFTYSILNMFMQLLGSNIIWDNIFHHGRKFYNSGCSKKWYILSFNKDSYARGSKWLKNFRKSWKLSRFFKFLLLQEFTAARTVEKHFQYSPKDGEPRYLKETLSHLIYCCKLCSML